MSEVIEVINVGNVLEDFRRRSEEDSANIRIPWGKSSDVKFVGSLTEINREAHFVTGSKYIGTWDAAGMAGVGRYTMPHGVIFEGEFRDGVFHGRGTLEWPQKQRIDGVWLRGKLQEKRYTFNDGLVFQEKDWDYCRFPDRRFAQCIKEGLNPAGRSLKTARQPSPVIPPSCYDTGDGIFNPNTLSVSSYKLPHKVIRNTTKEEAKWIIENCRKDSISPVGYQPLLNENWLTDPPNLPYSLPMSSDSPQSWWKRLSTFERDVEVKVDNEEPVLGGEDISHDLCNCDEFGSSEESFYSTSSEDYCICLKDKRYETDIQEEEYAAFREIVCDQLDKYDNFDLTKTVCIPPKSRKASSADFIEIKSQKSWEDDLSEEKIEDNASDLSVEREKREIENQKLLDEVAIKGSSLAENKLDMEDDERMKEEEIEETEEAEEELEELMMKSRDEEILRFSSKQEVDRKYIIEGEELAEDLEKRKEDKLKTSDSREEEKLANQTKAHFETIEDSGLDATEAIEEKDVNTEGGKDKLKDDLIGIQILKDSEDKEGKIYHLEEFKESEDMEKTEEIGEAGKDQLKIDLSEKQKLNDSRDKKLKSKTDNLEAFEESEDASAIGGSEDTDATNKIEKDKTEARLVEKEVLKDLKDKEDKTEYIEEFKESEDIDGTKEVEEEKLKDAFSEKLQKRDRKDKTKTENLKKTRESEHVNLTEEAGEDKFKASLPEEEKLKSQNSKEDQAKTDNLEKFIQTENGHPTEEVIEDKLRLSSSSVKGKLKNSASEKSSKDELRSSGEKKDKITNKLKTHDLLKGKSIGEEVRDGETKLLQIRSSPQLQDKKHKSGKEGVSRFSTTFDAPRSKLEFVRKPCHPKICSKDAPKGCAQVSEKDTIPSCKPRRAIEMVHLRVANKRCHE